MSLFRMHILIPIDEGTVQAGAFEVKRRLEKQLQEKTLDQEIKVLETGTVGIVGKGVILVRRETTPDDYHGMIAAQGILTSAGGTNSHAAVVARG